MPPKRVSTAVTDALLGSSCRLWAASRTRSDICRASPKSAAACTHSTVSTIVTNSSCVSIGTPAANAANALHHNIRSFTKRAINVILKIRDPGVYALVDKFEVMCVGFT